jgi:hypothetical protein
MGYVFLLYWCVCVCVRCILKTSLLCFLKCRCIIIQLLDQKRPMNTSQMPKRDRCSSSAILASNRQLRMADVCHYKRHGSCHRCSETAILAGNHRIHNTDTGGRSKESFFTTYAYTWSCICVYVVLHMCIPCSTQL